jgi:hypothetical protein
MSGGSHEIMALQGELNELKTKIAAAEQEGDKAMVHALIGLQTVVQEKQNLLLKLITSGSSHTASSIRRERRCRYCRTFV